MLDADPQPVKCGEFRSGETISQSENGAGF
jgi:hypothetical protein